MFATSIGWYRPYVSIERLNLNDLPVYNIIMKFGSHFSEYTFNPHPLSWRLGPIPGHGLLLRVFAITLQSVGLLWTRDQPNAGTSTDNTQHSQ